MLNLAFTPPKAELVMKLCDGDVAQTRRAMKHQPPSHWSIPPAQWDGKYLNRYGCQRDDESILARPRYIEGDICAVGHPHWRAKWNDQLVIAFDDGLTVTLIDDTLDVVQLKGPADRDHMHKLDFRRMAGRYLPAWAATRWALILRVWVERLQSISEEDAKAELVERAPAPIPACHDTRPWRDYEYADPECVYNRPTARESYRTMVCAVNHRDIWSENPFCFCYEFRICPKGEPK